MHQTGVRQDQCIDIVAGRTIDGLTPLMPLMGPGVGVDGHQYLTAFVMSIINRAIEFFSIKTQSGEIACIGAITKTQIDTVRAVIDGGF